MMGRYNWALHLVSAHTVLPGTPSVEEMLRYPQAFAKMLNDHTLLHARFETGHEHDPRTGAVIAPPAKKPGISFEIIDD